jgi:hypothetical protein
MTQKEPAMPTPTHNKVLNASYRLNAEAYEHQALQSVKSGRKMHQFTPCPKAETLMQHIRKGVHFGTAHAQAAAAHCTCHASLTESQLMDYEYDETYRKAHHRHDHRTLYPRLHK